MNEEIPLDPPLVGTVTKATAAGGITGAGGTAVAAWIAYEAQRRWGIPVAVTGAVLGSGYAFVTRWASKLIPS